MGDHIDGEAVFVDQKPTIKVDYETDIELGDQKIEAEFKVSSKGTAACELQTKANFGDWKAKVHDEFTYTFGDKGMENSFEAVLKNKDLGLKGSLGFECEKGDGEGGSCNIIAEASKNITKSCQLISHHEYDW